MECDAVQFCRTYRLPPSWCSSNFWYFPINRYLSFSYIFSRREVKVNWTLNNTLTLILLTWRIWWAPINASRWQMGFNSTFKGLRFWQIVGREVLILSSELEGHMLLNSRSFCFDSRDAAWDTNWRVWFGPQNRSRYFAKDNIYFILRLVEWILFFFYPLHLTMYQLHSPSRKVKQPHSRHFIFVGPCVVNQI